MGDLTYIQWRRLSTDGEREVLVRFAGKTDAGQKRYVVRTLDELPGGLAARLRHEWREPMPGGAAPPASGGEATGDDPAPCTEDPLPAQCVALNQPSNSERDL